MTEQEASLLFKNKNWEVRKKVAQAGYFLDVLVYDKEWKVRQEVAKNGYGLDILVNDPCLIIIYEVIKYGEKRHLDILSKHKLYQVRYSVNMRIKQNKKIKNVFNNILEKTLEFLIKLLSNKLKK